MFLTARIFGIFTYLALLVLALIATRYISRELTKYILWGYLLALCTMAWFYIPYITADVYRLQEYATHYAQIPWNDFLYHLSNSKSGLFTLVYYRLFSTCLMPVTCFIVFGVIFYILYYSGQLLQITRTTFMLTLLWIMTNDFFLTSISNIRSYVAVAFVSFCIYREIFEHKFNLSNIILYVCAAQMHAMGIVLVAFRAFAFLLTGGKITIWKIVLVPLLISFIIFGYSFYDYLLFNSVDKFGNYYTGNEYNYIWERVIFTIQSIVQLYILWKAYTYRLFREKLFSPYRMTITLAAIILIICHLHVTFTQRWIIFSAILEIPLLVRLLQKESERNRCQIKQFLILSCLATFAFVCTRGNLCSLKFWE